MSAQCLELGSGRGTTSMYLASKGCKITLVDLASAGLELAVKNFAACGLPAPRTELRDAQDTGLPSGTYNCVYNIGLLEHFEDPLPVLSEAIRLLRPGGMLFMVIIPDRSPWHALPLKLACNPLGTAVRFVRAVARRTRRLIAFPPGPQSAAGASGDENRLGMVRTNHSREQYIAWMHRLGESNVQCLSYNPYCRLYRSNVLERYVTVPLYRLHLASRRWRGKYPLMAASPGTASCYLLLARKS